MKKRKTTTLNICGRDFTRIWKCCLIPGRALMLFRGLRIFKILKIVNLFD